jgi:magnesium transporter
LLPELREMLVENLEAELREFCEELHPGRTAEFMEGLTPEETWAVLQYADDDTRVEVFGFFPEEKRISMVETLDPAEMAALVADSPPDDRVDLLDDVAPEVVDRIMPLLPVIERRDILRLSAYPEDTAGAAMTTEFAALAETLTVEQAFEELRRQAKEHETIYYIYVVDDEGHLRVDGDEVLLPALHRTLLQVGLPAISVEPIRDTLEQYFLSKTEGVMG